MRAVNTSLREPKSSCRTSNGDRLAPPRNEEHSLWNFAGNVIPNEQGRKREKERERTRKRPTTTVTFKVRHSFSHSLCSHPVRVRFTVHGPSHRQKCTSDIHARYPPRSVNGHALRKVALRYTRARVLLIVQSSISQSPDTIPHIARFSLSCFVRILARTGETITARMICIGLFELAVRVFRYR